MGEDWTKEPCSTGLLGMYHIAITVLRFLVVADLGLGAWKGFCGIFLCLAKFVQFWEVGFSLSFLEVLHFLLILTDLSAFVFGKGYGLNETCAGDTFSEFDDTIVGSCRCSTSLHIH